MISRFHNWRRRRKVMLLAAIAGAFLLSASFAVVLNSQGNSGEQVAEAASRVNRQVDDTQEAFTDIKDLIPEEQRLEAAPPASYDHRLTGNPVPPQPHLPTAVAAGYDPAPLAGDGYSEGGTYAADPADKSVPPALTFNQKFREVQGAEVLTQYQEARGRIVDDRPVRYQAAKRERVARSSHLYALS